MKKVTLIIALVATSFMAFSQVKSDTIRKSNAATEIAKPEYKLDPNTIYQIPLELRADEVQLLVASPEKWKAFKSGKATGEDIASAEEHAEEIRKSILGYLYRLQQLDHDKWVKANSLKVETAVKVKGRKLKVIN